MPEEVATVPKIKTAFPGLHAANGVKPEDMEIVAPGQAAATEAAKPPATPTDPPPAEAKPKFNLDDLSEEERDDMVKKLTGKSLSELNPPKEKTKEEIALEAEKVKADALAWALGGGKIKKDVYDRVAADRNKSDRELALKAFTGSLMAEDKDMTEEEAEEIFKDTYHETQETDSRLYGIGQKEIKKLADSYRKETFSAVDNIEAEYMDVVNFDSQYKGYKAHIKTVAGELPKEFSFEVNHKDVDGNVSPLSYKIPLDDKVIAKLTAEFGSESQFSIRNVTSNGKIDIKAIAKEMNDRAKSLMFDTIIPQLLENHGNEVEKRMIAIMGNKRNPGQTLNNGQQNTSDPNAPKVNSYPSLRLAAEKQKY